MTIFKFMKSIRLGEMRLVRTSFSLAQSSGLQKSLFPNLARIYSIFSIFHHVENSVNFIGV